MAPRIRCFLYKHDDQTLDSPAFIQKQSVVAHICNLSVEEGGRWLLGASLTRQSHQMVQKGFVSKMHIHTKHSSTQYTLMRTHLFKMVTSEETEFEVMGRAFLNIRGYFTLSERVWNLRKPN